LIAAALGVWPLATVFGVSGRSAPEPLGDEPNWEIPPVCRSVAYTNGATADRAGRVEDPHAASVTEQMKTASTCRR
jgi:hypothetical protein